MLIDRLTLTTLLLTTTLAGCSFYTFQQRHLESKFRRAGLHEYRASLPQGELHYWAGGNPSGAPLLLVHGFGADALWGWIGQTSFARDRFLIVPDLMWFGGSHGRADDFSTEAQGQAIAALLDHLAMPKVDVVGISYGGFVTLELAHARPERVRRVVLVDSPGHTYTLDDYHALLERQQIDSVADLVVPPDPSGVQRLVRLAYYRPPPVPLFVARDLFAHMFATHNDQKVRLLDHLLSRAATITADAYEIPHDTLVLWGEHDELFPPPLGERLAAAIGPQARFELLPATNHAPNLERPLAFNRALRRFLDAP